MSRELVYFFGDIAIDDYWRFEAWPGLGDKAVGDRLESRVGGMVANAARVHASLGGAAEFVSVVRPDDDGDRMLAVLRDDGVPTEHVVLDPDAVNGRTQVCLVRDEHVVLIQRPDTGPIHVPDATWRAMCTPGWLVTNLPRLRRIRTRDALGAEQALHALDAAGRRVVVDTDVDGFDGDDLVGQAAVVIVNDHGFRRTFANDNAALDWLGGARTSMLVRTRGPDGATAYTTGEVVEKRGYDVAVVDVTGAGDAFTGALAYALAHDWAVADGLELATAVSARSVCYRGPASGRASLQEIHDFMTERGTR